MAEGMPYYKPHKAPVENSDERLEDIEKQASLLFEEFLRLAEPAHPAGLFQHAKSEQSDSPVVRNERQFKGDGECCEAFEDDLVTDSEIITKGSSHDHTAPFGATQQPTADPRIHSLACQLQQVGDAFTEQYKGRVQGTGNYLVSYVIKNAASLTYESLSREVDNMIGIDRNWSNFAMVMHVSARVVKETSRVCGGVKEYFSRYVSQSYSRAMQQAGGMEPFVKSKGYGH